MRDRETAFAGRIAVRVLIVLARIRSIISCARPHGRHATGRGNKEWRAFTSCSIWDIAKRLNENEDTPREHRVTHLTYPAFVEELAIFR